MGSAPAGTVVVALGGIRNRGVLNGDVGEDTSVFVAHERVSLQRSCVGSLRGFFVKHNTGWDDHVHTRYR